MAGILATGTRCAALVGPYQSGKTTLLESLLYATGATPRKGSTVARLAIPHRRRGLDNAVLKFHWGIQNFWATSGCLLIARDRLN